MKTRLDRTSGSKAKPSEPKRFGRADLARMGQFLRDERQARGLSLRALAERSGLSAGAIRALEAGQANPGLATALAVVEALDVDLDRAVESARAGRTSVAVHRAGEDAAAVFAGAALGLNVSELPAKSVGPSFGSGEAHPSMGLVAEGTVLAVVRSGTRHRLEKGDVYHAQPGVVQGLAAAGSQPARIMHVVDTRRTAERPATSDETRN